MKSKRGRSPEAPAIDIPADPAGPSGNGKRIAAIIATLATLVGGVATRIQVFQFFQPAGPSAERLAEGWQRLELPAGVSIATPANWKGVDSGALSARLQLVGSDPALLLEPFDGVTEFVRPPKASYLAKGIDEEGRGAVFAAFFVGQTKSPANFKEDLDDPELRQQFLVFEAFENKLGKGLRALSDLREAPGEADPLVADIDALERGADVWLAILVVPAKTHLAEAGEFQRSVESMRVVKGTP